MLFGYLAYCGGIIIIVISLICAGETNIPFRVCIGLTVFGLLATIAGAFMLAIRYVLY